MMRRRAALLGILPLLALMPGCASRREMPVDTALFPRIATAPDPRAPGRVALLLQPAVRDLVHEGEDGPARQMRIPIGQIVAQAMLSSADEAFAGGAQRVDAPAHTGSGFVATLVVQSARVSYHRRLLWLIPIPFGGVGDFEFDAQLALDVSLLDAQGRTVWTHSYDDGRQIWKHDWREQGQAQDGLLRLTHEAAWRLSQQVARDLRDWMEAERMRPRDL
jgi:hypothetical protein